jgi:acetylornithine deacetylase/succinyl-diaminopimelate desuccinylase-like protein
MYEFEPAPGRISLIGVFESRQPSASLLANAHLDTVPAGRGWTVDPFAGEVRDSTIYGRGAIDHKSPIAALLHAVGALKEHDRLPSRLILVFDADEEMGGKCGMHHLLRKADLNVDYALYAVPTSFSEGAARFFSSARENVFCGSIGSARVRIAYETRLAYTVAPVEWWHAPEVAVAAASELRDALVAPSWFGGRPRARLREVSNDSQLWEVHVLPGEPLQSVMATVRATVGRVVESFVGASASVELVEAVGPATTSPSNPLVAAIVEGALAATGRRPQVGWLGTVTGMSVIQEHLHVPIAAFGYGEIELCHRPDERIAVDDLVASSVAYAEAIARLPR